MNDISEPVAWWLGVFAADGNVTVPNDGNPRIQFGMKDLDCIEKLMDICSCTNKVYYISEKDVYCFSFRSRIVYSKLCEIFGHDIQRKSNTLVFPELPEDKIQHFIRGEIDGDGSIGFDGGVPVVNISSNSEKFIIDIKEQILRKTGIVCNEYSYKGSSKLIASGIKAICLLLWVNRGATVWLDRKRERLNQVEKWKPRFVLRTSLTPKMNSIFGEEGSIPCAIYPSLRI